MPSQWSTVASDGVLAFAALQVCYRLLAINIHASLGVCMMGIAASLGTVRFFLSDPMKSLIDWHQYMSWLSAAFGVPLIASGYIRGIDNLSSMANFLVACGMAGWILRRILSDSVATGFSTIAAGASVLSMLVLSVVYFNANIIVFAVLFLIAAGPVGTNGNWIGMLRVDIFHYLLALAVLSLMKGLSDRIQPVYYRG